MQPRVVFEDQWLMVLDKPAGMVVNKAETTKGQVTLEDYLEENFQFSIFNFQELRHGIVHRLDKETSGLLLVAKTSLVMEKLQQQFKARKVTKEYLALVHGQIRPAQGQIRTPISRNPFNRKRFGVFLAGRQAVTDYQLEAVYKKDDQLYSLVRVWPRTGRTHQIRVHFQSIKQPLVADSLYAGRKTSRENRVWCPRLWLQAVGLGFKHPVTNKKLQFNLAIASDLELVLKKLKKI